MGFGKVGEPNDERWRSIGGYRGYVAAKSDWLDVQRITILWALWLAG